ncbi:MAG: hypothetical protein KIS96_12470 [Bauldia sp.]|nr:hypothetical protein [Bauldia sp.]
MNAITQIEAFEATVVVGHPAVLDDDHHAIPTNRFVTARMHPGVLWLAVGAYVALVAAFFIGFAGPRDLWVSLGIVAVTLAAFVGLPAVMARTGGVLRGDGTGLNEFLNGYFQTATGPITGKGALALVVTIPVCLTAAAIAMAIIFATV